MGAGPRPVGPQLEVGPWCPGVGVWAAAEWAWPSRRGAGHQGVGGASLLRVFGGGGPLISISTPALAGSLQTFTFTPHNVEHDVLPIASPQPASSTAGSQCWPQAVILHVGALSCSCFLDLVWAGDTCFAHLCFLQHAGAQHRHRVRTVLSVEVELGIEVITNLNSLKHLSFPKGTQKIGFFLKEGSMTSE